MEVGIDTAVAEDVQGDAGMMGASCGMLRVWMFVGGMARHKGGGMSRGEGKACQWMNSLTSRLEPRVV